MGIVNCGDHGGAGHDAFESQNPAFGTVRRASALPNAQGPRKSILTRQSMADPESDHGRESRQTIHHDFSTAEHFTRPSEEIHTANPLSGSGSGVSLTPLLDSSTKKSPPLFSPSPGSQMDVSQSLADTYPEQSSAPPQFHGVVPPPPARKSRRGSGNVSAP